MRLPVTGASSAVVVLVACLAISSLRAGLGAAPATSAMPREIAASARVVAPPALAVPTVLAASIRVAALRTPSAMSAFAIHPAIAALPVLDAPRGPAASTASASPGAAASSKAAAPTAAGESQAQSLFEQMLRRCAGFSDFQARFVETAISRASGEGTPESGTVSFKRPDLWRWEYVSPEKKVVVVRGKIAAIAVEGDPEVPRYDLGDTSEQSGVGSLLAGGEKLTHSFSARFDPSGSKDEPVLRLDPLKVSEEYDYVLVRLSRRDASVREVVIVDPGGNRLRFEFENLQANHGLPDRLFALPEASAPVKH